MDQTTFVQGFHDEEKVKKMSYHKLGNTDMYVSKMSLGGSPLGGVYGKTAEDECVKVVQTAIKAGVNYIDTAPFYGLGRSEEVIGKALKSIPRKAYYIGTKVGRYGPDIQKMFNFSAKNVEESVDKSLTLLGLDYVDVLQVHDLEFAESTDVIVNETLPALEKIVKQGKARYIGITGYPLYVLKEVIEKSKVKIDVILTYCRNTLIDDSIQDYLPYLQRKGIGVISACAVGMGLLTSNMDVRPWHPAPTEVREAAKQARDYANSKGVDIAKLAIHYSTAREGVASHLIGASSCDIILSNLETITTPPTDLELGLITEIREKFFKPLSKKHWEGHDVDKYWKGIRQLRGELPPDENDTGFYDQF